MKSDICVKNLRTIFFLHLLVYVNIYLPYITPIVAFKGSIFSVYYY